jgi:hypothetical protein
VDPITIIAGALAAGALKGAGETATSAVKDAYAALKSALAIRFAEREVSVEVLDEHEDDPETYEKPLAKRLQQADAGSDPRIVELAEALMRLMDDSTPRPGKYNVDVRDAQGVQIGDHSTQHNTFS